MICLYYPNLRSLRYHLFGMLFSRYYSYVFQKGLQVLIIPTNYSILYYMYYIYKWKDCFRSNSLGSVHSKSLFFFEGYWYFLCKIFFYCHEESSWSLESSKNGRCATCKVIDVEYYKICYSGCKNFNYIGDILDVMLHKVLTSNKIISIYKQIPKPGKRYMSPSTKASLETKNFQ